jgi:hypothetical protein
MAITIPVPSPASTTNAGLDTTGNLAINSSQLKIDMFPDVFWVDRGQTPIVALLAQRARSKPATEILVQWLEDSSIPSNLTPSTSYNNSATSVVLTTGQGAWVNVGDVILDAATSELLYVSAVSGDTLTVTRGYAGTSAQNIGSTDNFINMRQASGHGTTSPTALQTVTSTKSNFCQIRKTAVQVTKTLDAVQLYGGNERQRQRVMKAQEHSIDWETILLHGIKASITNVNNPVYLAGGMDNYIATNKLSVSGALTEATFLDFMPQVFRYSSNPGARAKVLFASAEIINTINSWGLSKLQVTEASNAASQTYGIDIKEYVHGYGKLFVVYHPLLMAGFKGYGYIIDMDNIWMRPLRPTTLETNIQAPDADLYKDQYLTESSFQVANEITMGVISGVTF